MQEGNSQYILPPLGLRLRLLQSLATHFLAEAPAQCTARAFLRDTFHFHAA